MSCGCVSMMFLDLYAQKVADVALIIDSALVGVCAQICDNLIDGLAAWPQNKAIVNVDQEHDGPTVVEARIELAQLEADFAHSLVHEIVPHTAGLFLAIHVS